ncbi:hypothetical protein TNCV_1187941 [Trichonephila clavipes]|nr:hypothetical protein TNCV_1187941 [Trichonephila clavipes]
MSRQRDLPESRAWRIIGRLGSRETQRTVADAVQVAKIAIARLWNRFQETGHVRRRSTTFEVGLLVQQPMRAKVNSAHLSIRGH